MEVREETEYPTLGHGDVVETDPLSRSSTSCQNQAGAEAVDEITENFDVDGDLLLNHEA